MFLIFALVIIYNVEMRWLVPITLAGILFYADWEILPKSKFSNYAISLNYLVIVLMMIYGTVKLVIKDY